MRNGLGEKIMHKDYELQSMFDDLVGLVSCAPCHKTVGVTPKYVVMIRHGTHYYGVGYVWLQNLLGR